MAVEGPSTRLIVLVMLSTSKAFYMYYLCSQRNEIIEIILAIDLSNF